MTRYEIKNLINSIKKGQNTINSLSSKEKSSLEKTWDVEHAYYSSALEGSKLDRKEFEKFANKIA